MTIIRLHFYLLLCCGAAEAITEKKVDLGQNVTLQCQVAVDDVYWYLTKPSECPMVIFRSFSSTYLVAQYFNPDLSKTFILQLNSRLFIHNISTNELGYYYCIQAKTGSPPRISTGIRLYIQNNSTVPDQVCKTEQQKNRTADTDDEVWRRIMIISGIMNCVVLVSITVLLMSRCARFRSLKYRMKPPKYEESLSGSQDNSNVTAVVFNQHSPGA